MINELPIDLNNKRADALNPFDFIKRMRPWAPVGNITRVGTGPESRSYQIHYNTLNLQRPSALGI